MTCAINPFRGVGQKYPKSFPAGIIEVAIQVQGSPGRCSELQTRRAETANKAMQETTLAANRGGLKTTLVAAETTLAANRLQTRFSNHIKCK